MSIIQWRDRPIRVPGGRVVITPGARDQIAAPMLAEIRRHADEIAAAANAASSWGGYQAVHLPSRSRVYGLNGGGDSDRGRRLLQLAGSRL